LYFSFVHFILNIAEVIHQIMQKNVLSSYISRLNVDKLIFHILKNRFIWLDQSVGVTNVPIKYARSQEYAVSITIRNCTMPVSFSTFAQVANNNSFINQAIKNCRQCMQMNNQKAVLSAGKRFAPLRNPQTTMNCIFKHHFCPELLYAHVGI